MHKTAAIFLARGVEDTEAVACIDVLTRAHVKLTTFAVPHGDLISLTVRCANGVQLLADKLVDEFSPDEFDAMVLPGGGLAAETFAKVCV